MLTKSDLQSVLQCRRKLWLEHHRPDLIPRDDPFHYRRATDGNIVGEHARMQLGPDFIWPPSSTDHTAAADKAKQLLANSPTKPAAEVPMLHDGLYARADGLVPERQAYILRETKASTFPLKRDKATPDKPEEHHLNDLAIQTWVMLGSGLRMARAELNLLNNQWRYPGGEDYSGLFRQLDTTTDVKRRAKQVPRWRQEAEATISGEMPELSTGKQCTSPYPCPFIGYCETLNPPSPEHPIDLLPGLAGKNLARKLQSTQGYSSILEPKRTELVGKDANIYRRIQQAHSSNKPVLVPTAKKAMDKFPYPRYFLDFETIDFPVPRWAGVRPYEHIPFQWSCHIERAPGKFEHAEFLDLTGNNPSVPCIEKMRSVIDRNDGPIFVYFATYEKGRLEELSQRHPEFSDLTANYVGRLVDLLPLVRDHYYHPKMQGSFSIKKVLPTIAPDLDYGKLQGVQDGTEAQVAYLYAVFDPKTGAKRKAELEAMLRKYCRQDTWAMVEIAYSLAQSGRPLRPPEGHS